MDMRPYPMAVFCIIATEFCERFSFCGLRTILSIYLRNELLFSENAATVIYHVFIMGCYVVPLVGAVCADSFLGRYRTILYFSLVYLVGNILMCLGAIPTIEMSSVTLSALGLILISIGTGGIKPCVAAFGGDQFRLPDQSAMLQHFFSIFYFTINLGGFVGMIITPILRKWVSCFGDDTCYALGFGFPAALMVLALVLFIMGKPWYKLRTPKENVVVNFLKCIMYALANRSKVPTNRKKKQHWLDVAKHKYTPKQIMDMKRVCAVLFLYLPLPIFWSLFDQQGSRWTFQASHMDGNVMGMQIVPDQMQVVNPAMVLLLIPIFDRILNPWFNKSHVLENSLHRMAIGGLFACMAFLSAGILEIVLERDDPSMPEKRHASVYIVNTLPCDVEVEGPLKNHVPHELSAGGLLRMENLPCDNFTRYDIVVGPSMRCGTLYFGRHKYKLEAIAVELQSSSGGIIAKHFDLTTLKCDSIGCILNDVKYEVQGFSESVLGHSSHEFCIVSEKPHRAAVKTDTVLIGINTNNMIETYVTDPVDFQKSLSGKPRLRVVYLKGSNRLHNVTVSLRNTAGLQDIYFIHNSQFSYLADSAYMELPQGIYDCTVKSTEMNTLYEETLHLRLGGVYSLVIRERNTKIEFFKLIAMSIPNKVSILWLLPQYFLISVAEILFGVAGLEFSFTQAPKCMKTVTIAGWYLSVGLGNLLVILITQASFLKSQAQEFFLFAVVMVADMMIFVEMASGYRFVQIEADSTACFLHEVEEDEIPLIER